MTLRDYQVSAPNSVSDLELDSTRIPQFPFSGTIFMHSSVTLSSGYSSEWLLRPDRYKPVGLELLSGIPHPPKQRKDGLKKQFKELAGPGRTFFLQPWLNTES